jgi:hypothetical protein
LNLGTAVTHVSYDSEGVTYTREACFGSRERDRGGFEVDISWQDGDLVEARIRSLNGNPLKLRYGTQTHEGTPAKGSTIQWNGRTSLSLVE